MRIEINAGGLTSFFDGVSRFTNSAVSNSAQLISGLQAARNRATRLPLGTGPLGPALMFIDNRIRNEEHRVVSVMRVMQKAAQFRETAIATDNRVAAMVNHEWEKFYQANPWLRPSPPPGLLERVVRGVARLYRTAAEIRSNVWNSIVDWYNENRWVQLAARVLIGVAAIALGVLLTVVTGGAALPFLIKAGIVVGASMAAGGIYAAATGGNVLDGIVNGFMAGGIAMLAVAVVGLAAISAKGAGIATLVTTGSKKGSILLTNTGKHIANTLGGFFGGGMNTFLNGGSFGDVISNAAKGGVFSFGVGWVVNKLPNLGSYISNRLNPNKLPSTSPDMPKPDTSRAIEFFENLFKNYTKDYTKGVLFPKKEYAYN